MIENMSIEQFYLLYKVGEVCKALLVFPAVVGGVAFAVLKVGREAANSETAQRLIDEALRRLEAQEKGGEK